MGCDSRSSRDQLIVKVQSYCAVAVCYCQSPNPELQLRGAPIMDGIQSEIPIRPLTVGLALSLFADSALNLLLGLLNLTLGSLGRLCQLLLGHVLLSSPVVVVQVSVSLCKLSTSVDEVAGEEKVVPGCNGQRVSHERSGIDDESTGHLSRDPKGSTLVVGSQIGQRGFIIQFRALLCIHDSRQRDTKVGDGTPEV